VTRLRSFFFERQQVDYQWTRGRVVLSLVGQLIPNTVPAYPHRHIMPLEISRYAFFWLALRDVCREEFGR